MFGKYIFILLILQFIVVACNTSVTCRPFKLMHEHSNRRLVGHGFFEKTTHQHDCVKNCMFMSVCKSMDYSLPTQNCKLNDVDSLSVLASDFEIQSGAVFSDVIGWPKEMAGSCGDRPCSSQQLCVPTEPHRCIDIRCGRLPSILYGTVNLVEPDRNFLLDKASVVCDEGHVSDQSYIICKAPEKLDTATCEHEDQTSLKCTITGTWEAAVCSLQVTLAPSTITVFSAAATTTTMTIPTTPGCTTQPGEFMGVLSTTVNGNTCQRWDSQSPHGHGYTSDGSYPDATVSDAGNYCRALGESYLWCYTISSIRWEKCEKPVYVC